MTGQPQRRPPETQGAEVLFSSAYVFLREQMFRNGAWRVSWAGAKADYLAVSAWAIRGF